MGTIDRPARFAPSRRAVLAAGLGALVVASVPLARRPRRRRFARTAPSMGTVAEVLVVDEDGARAHRAIDAALAELARVEGLMTRYDATSEVGRANRAGRGVAVRVSAETAEVVEDALRWAEASEGEFDPCLERAIALWDVGERRVPPPAGEVARLAGRGLYRGVDVVVAPAGAGGTIRFAEADAALDLGGIAKGHAVDRAADALRRLGVRDAVVNVGGDLVALGRSENGDPWRVGIRSAGDPDGLDGHLEVSDLAVATSGDYERYFDYEGRRYHHILDASTASPRRCAAHSVTVLASTCREADAAATTVFGRPEAWAARVLRARAPGARIVATA